MTSILKEQILQEHQRAELQRLNDGWAGCGCADCQDFYKSIELTNYGERVQHTADIITINEDSRKLNQANAIHWSDCGMIEYHDGRAYTTDRKGKTWDIGTEQSVRETLKTGVIASNLCLDGRREALDDVIEYREVEGYGTTTARLSLERSTDNGTIGDKQKTTRPSKNEQRVSNRLSKFKS